MTEPNTVTLAEMAESYAMAAQALTMQIDELLAQRSLLRGTALYQTDAVIEALRVMRRESRGIAARLLHYYD